MKYVNGLMRYIAEGADPVNLPGKKIKEDDSQKSKLNDKPGEVKIDGEFSDLGTQPKKEISKVKGEVPSEVEKVKEGAGVRKKYTMSDAKEQARRGEFEFLYDIKPGVNKVHRKMANGKWKEYYIEVVNDPVKESDSKAREKFYGVGEKVTFSAKGISDQVGVIENLVKPGSGMVYYEISYIGADGVREMVIKSPSEIKPVEGKEPTPNDAEPEKRKKLTEISIRTAMDVLDKFVDKAEHEKAADMFGDTKNFEPKSFVQAAKQLVPAGKFAEFKSELKKVVDPEDKFSEEDLFEAATFNKDADIQKDTRVVIGEKPTAGAIFKGQKGVVTKADPNSNFASVLLDIGYERSFYTKDLIKATESVVKEEVASGVISHLDHAIEALNKAKLEKGFLAQFEPGIKKAVEIVTALKDKHLGAAKLTPEGALEARTHEVDYNRGYKDGYEDCKNGEPSKLQHLEGVVPTTPDDSAGTMKDLVEEKASYACFARVEKDIHASSEEEAASQFKGLVLGAVRGFGGKVVDFGASLRESKDLQKIDALLGAADKLLENHPGIEATIVMVKDALRICEGVLATPGERSADLMYEKINKIRQILLGAFNTLRNMGHVGESVNEKYSQYKEGLVDGINRSLGVVEKSKTLEEARIGIERNLKAAEASMKEGKIPTSVDEDTSKTLAELLEYNVLDFSTMKMVMKDSKIRVFSMKEASEFISNELAGKGRAVEVALPEEFRDPIMEVKEFDKEPSVDEVGAPSWIKADEDKARWKRAVEKALSRGSILKDKKIQYGMLVAIYNNMKKKEQAPKSEESKTESGTEEK